MAEAFGCRAIRVEEQKGLAAALADAVALPEPAVVDVATDPEAVAPVAWTPA